MKLPVSKRSERSKRCRGKRGKGGGRQKVNCETAIRHLRLNKLPAVGAAMARVRVTQLAQRKKS